MTRAALFAFVTTFLASLGAAAGEPCPLDAFPANGGGVLDPAVVELHLDARISEALLAVGATPGLAVGVVEGDRVVYARGFGRRSLETCEPVTPSTLFYLLSVTKSFTGMAAALLHEDGKVK
ncbi:MAG: beta-lactamase family protein, partial [Acidobacteria bacterium]|nr:beta-lactamase family protein [Acidobacteriota bacterium]